jgi:hypothetical protein
LNRSGKRAEHRIHMEFSGPTSLRAHEECLANRAAVISTGIFTPAAQELARSTGRLLLHHDQIGGLSDMLLVHA